MNQPMYGVEDQGFFASFRCYTRYVKITFFHGAELDPVPPVDFKDPNEKAFTSTRTTTSTTSN